MSWTRCVSSLGCPELSLEAAMEVAAKHRIPAIELRALGGTVDLPAYFTAVFETPSQLAARMLDAQVRITAFNTSLRLMGASEAGRAQVEAYAPWAEALGVRWLRVFDGGNVVDAAELSQAADIFDWWEDLRAARGWRVDLMVETHDALCTNAALKRFIAAMPQCAILWDAHHTWRKGGEDPVSTWQAIHTHVVHVHVKDSIGVPSERHPFTYVLPGDGDFPMASVVRALNEAGYAGAVSLEWEKLWHPYLPSLDEALAVAAARRWW